MLKIDKCIVCNRQLYWSQEDQLIILCTEVPDHICTSQYPIEFLTVWSSEITIETTIDVTEAFFFWVQGRAYQSTLIRRKETLT